MNLYDHKKYGSDLDYRFLLANNRGYGLLFRLSGKIHISDWNGIVDKYISSSEFIIDTDSIYNKHIFLSPSNDIIIKCNDYRKDIYVNIKTLEEYEDDISDLRLLIKN